MYKYIIKLEAQKLYHAGILGAYTRHYGTDSVHFIVNGTINKTHLEYFQKFIKSYSFKNVNVSFGSKQEWDKTFYKLKHEWKKLI